MIKISTWILLSVLATSAPASATPHLPFIGDDFGSARAEAGRRRLPLFVEVWAPW